MTTFQSAAAVGTAAAVLAATTSAWAEPADADRVRATATAGVEYDTNVSASDIDSATGVGDVAGVFDAEIEGSANVDDATQATLGYSFSQTLYQSFSAFNMQSHMANADLSRAFGDVEAGLSLRSSYSRLGGASFLTLNQAAPFVSRMFGDSFYLRADYSYSKKNFIGRADRDACSHAVSGDVYFFLRGARSSLAFGAKGEWETAGDSAFSFDAWGLRARVTHKISLAGRDAALRLGARYDDRAYIGLTPSIGAPRADQRTRLTAAFEAPITDHVFGALNYEYAIFQSNVAAFDYRQSVGSAKLGARF